MKLYIYFCRWCYWLQGIETDTSLTFNPSQNILTTTRLNCEELTVTADILGDLDGIANIATNVTVSANNTTNETVYLTFVDGATGTQGIETDTGLTYNPSSGVLTTTSVSGNLTGNVTGNTTFLSNSNRITDSKNYWRCII